MSQFSVLFTSVCKRNINKSDFAGLCSSRVVEGRSTVDQQVVL